MLKTLFYDKMGGERKDSLQKKGEVSNIFLLMIKDNIYCTEGQRTLLHVSIFKTKNNTVIRESKNLILSSGKILIKLLYICKIMKYKKK